MHCIYSRENIPYLQGLELADNLFGHSELEVDLLVGGDFYWQFITSGRIIRGNMDPPQLSHVLDGYKGGQVHVKTVSHVCHKMAVFGKKI